jgi:hypothetical protein
VGNILTLTGSMLVLGTYVTEIHEVLGQTGRAIFPCLFSAQVLVYEGRRVDQEEGVSAKIHVSGNRAKCHFVACPRKNRCVATIPQTHVMVAWDVVYRELARRGEDRKEALGILVVPTRPIREE